MKTILKAIIGLGMFVVGMRYVNKLEKKLMKDAEKDVNDYLKQFDRENVIDLDPDDYKVEVQ